MAGGGAGQCPGGPQAQAGVAPRAVPYRKPPPPPAHLGEAGAVRALRLDVGDVSREVAELGGAGPEGHDARRGVEVQALGLGRRHRHVGGAAAASGPGLGPLTGPAANTPPRPAPRSHWRAGAATDQWLWGPRQFRLLIG